MSEARVALITGASSGIGLATAIALCKRGFQLSVTGPVAVELDIAIRQLPAATFAVVGDLDNLDFTRELVAKTQGNFGRIDLLVNCAAWRELFTMREVDHHSWERTLRICLTAPAFLAREVAVDMEARGSGVIVNVSSVMANRGFGVATAYIAAKAGLDAVTRELAILYGRSGVRVIGIAPGAVDTACSADLDQSQGSDKLRAFSNDIIPIGRWASPEEVALAIVALASSDFTYLNGTTVTFDGGWSGTLYPRSILEPFYGGAKR